MSTISEKIDSINNKLTGQPFSNIIKLDSYDDYSTMIKCGRLLNNVDYKIYTAVDKKSLVQYSDNEFFGIIPENGIGYLVFYKNLESSESSYSISNFFDTSYTVLSYKRIKDNYNYIDLYMLVYDNSNKLFIYRLKGNSKFNNAELLSTFNIDNSILSGYTVKDFWYDPARSDDSFNRDIASLYLLKEKSGIYYATRVKSNSTTEDINTKIDISSYSNDNVENVSSLFIYNEKVGAEPMIAYMKSIHVIVNGKYFITIDGGSNSGIRSSSSIKLYSDNINLSEYDFLYIVDPDNMNPYEIRTYMITTKLNPTYIEFELSIDYDTHSVNINSIYTKILPQYDTSKKYITLISDFSHGSTYISFSRFPENQTSTQTTKDIENTYSVSYNLNKINNFGKTYIIKLKTGNKVMCPKGCTLFKQTDSSINIIKDFIIKEDGLYILYFNPDNITDESEFLINIYKECPFTVI